MVNHPDPQDQPATGPDDLDRNPGIGQSPGLKRGEDLEDLGGETTFEGDIENDVRPDGSVDPDQRGRDHP